MKNIQQQNKLTELHPATSHLSDVTAYSSDDDISLIDLTLVLLKRKWHVLTILGLCLLAGLLYSLLYTSQVNYTMTMKLGTQIIENEVEPLETPETLMVKINHSFIPETLAEFTQAASISVSNPKKSEVILLKLSSRNLDEPTAIKLLNNLAVKIEQDQNKIYNNIKKNLQTNLKPVSIAAFAAQTASLQNTYVVSEPIKSSSKPNSNLILAASLFAGLFLGVFAAFFAEFWSKVKEEQNKVISFKF